MAGPIPQRASLRLPAVAGQFYPGDPDELRAMVDALLAGGRGSSPAPKVLIAPHAGYVYSGPIAGSAFKALEPVRATIRRVVVAGPTHRIPFRGIALSAARVFRTPLGDVRVDEAATARIAALPGVTAFEPAHQQEHSVEVHLPFLQRALDDFAIVPLVTGDASTEEVAAVFDALWGGAETLFSISTDLSHYLPYTQACQIDAATADAIEHLAPERIGPRDACGAVPLRAILAVARSRKRSVARLDLRNSGDTAGPREDVVGYGAWSIF